MKLLRRHILAPGFFSAALILSGCGEHKHDQARGSASGHTGHHHVPPHGGVAVELSDAFSLELVPDESSGSLKAYVLDGCLEKFIRLPSTGFDVQLASGTNTAVVRLAPSANPATGETAGDTSLFSSAEGALKVVAPAGPATVNGVIPLLDVRGNRFTNVQFQLPLKGPKG